MKFNHQFILTEHGETFRQYEEENNIVRLDFLDENILRVAVFKKDTAFLPTFCIDPGNKEIPSTGREKLSTEGFPGYTPTVQTPSPTDGTAIPSDCPQTTQADPSTTDPTCCIGLVDANPNTDIFTLGNIEIHLNKSNFLLDYYVDGKRLFGDRGPLAYNIDGEFGAGSKHYISREDGECIFGLGDKGGDLNKAGRRFLIETSDCMGYNAKSSDPLYKHVPFFICENSVGSYGIFYDTTDSSVMDCGAEINNYYEHFKIFSTDDDSLVYYVFFGSKLKILQTFCKTVGRQAFPPKWSMDYCASTMAYTDAPDAEAQMNDFLKKIDILNINCTGFYMSSGYTQIGNQRCVFHWNKEKFPDPARFIKGFNDVGVNLIPNIKPAFLTSHPLYNEIADKGYFVKNKDGSPFVTQFWDGLGSYLDFTNPDAYDYWSDKVKTALLDYGIQATWNDNNEFDIKDKDATAVGFGNGKVSASRIRSDLTYLMVKSSDSAQRAKYPALRPFLSTRSGNIGVRRLAQTWSGDNRTAFEDLRYCHNIGLTMSMSGMFLYGHDLGGFAGPQPDAELLLRWIQHGVFEPRFTIHSWNSDGSATMPWTHPDVLPEVQELFAQRKSLIPYLYNAVYNSVTNDVPVNAPVFLLFEDKNIPVENDAMMLGSSILAGFVFDRGRETTKIYLPADCDWFINGSRLPGGHTVEYMFPANGVVPYFVKEGSVLPLDEGEKGFRKAEKLVFTVYPIVEGSFEDSFFTDDGLTYDYENGNCTRLKFSVECSEDDVVVSVTNDGKVDTDYEIKLVPSDKRNLIIK